MAKNQRLHPRLECLASIKVKAGGEAIVLSTRNISLGGALLDVKERDRKLLPVGAKLDVTLFDAMDDNSDAVSMPAAVVRHDESGVALVWSGNDPDTTSALATLLEALKPRR